MGGVIVAIRVTCRVVIRRERVGLVERIGRWMRAECGTVVPTCHHGRAEIN